MKTYINSFKKILPIAVLLAGFSCVDDYTEAHDPVLPDGPAVFVDPPASSITSRRSDNTDVVYIQKGSPATFTVNVVDAPGLIDSVSAYLSDTVGTVAVSGFESVMGGETGSFSYVYTPEPDDAASTFDDRVVSAGLTVSDQNKKTTQPDTKLVRAIDCLPSRNLAGWWKVTMSGNTSEPFEGDNGDGTYTNLTSYVRLQIRTTGTTGGVSNSIGEHAGTLFISDGTLGLNPKQGYAARTGRVTFCGNDLISETVTGDGVVLTGSITPEGNLALSWSNNFGDTGEAVLVYDGN